MYKRFVNVFMFLNIPGTITHILRDSLLFTII